jgi:hypothetical protein
MLEGFRPLRERVATFLPVKRAQIGYKRTQFGYDIPRFESEPAKINSVTTEIVNDCASCRDYRELAGAGGVPLRVFWKQPAAPSLCSADFLH